MTNSKIETIIKVTVSKTETNIKGGLIMERLRNLREESNLNQEFMAKFLNISSANYCKKESGSIKFSLQEAKKIADFFNKTIEEIFFADKVSKNDTL